MGDVPRRPKTEREFGKQFNKLSKRHREELVALLGDPPDWRNVPDRFWEKVQRDYEAEVGSMLMMLLIMVMDDEGLSGDFTDYGSRWAESHAGKVSRDYVAASKRMVKRYGRTWDERIGKGLPVDDVSKKVESVFGSARDAKVIATEATKAASKATLKAAVELQTDEGSNAKEGVDYLVMWRLDPNCNHCMLCPAVADTPREQWSQWLPAPPAHAHCCCFLEIVPMGSQVGSLPSVSVLRSAADDAGVPLKKLVIEG